MVSLSWMREGVLPLWNPFVFGLALPIAAFFITYFFRRTGWLITIWALFIPVSYFLGENIYLIFENVLFISDERFNDLYSQSFRSNVVRAFRLDFIIYSAIS